MPIFLPSGVLPTTSEITLLEPVPNGAPTSTCNEMLGHPQSHHGVARIFSNCGAKVLASGKPCFRSQFNNASSSGVTGREVEAFSSSIRPTILKESLNNSCRQTSIPPAAKARDDFLPFGARLKSRPFIATKLTQANTISRCAGCASHRRPARRTPCLRGAACLWLSRPLRSRPQAACPNGWFRRE